MFTLEGKKHSDLKQQTRNEFRQRAEDSPFEHGDIYIYIIMHIYMGVSINRRSPKWMVYNGTSQSKMDDLGVLPNGHG